MRDMKVTNIRDNPKFSIPKSAIEALRDLGGFTLEDLGRPKDFYLRRRKVGTEIWFTYSGSARLTVNMSVHHNVWPENFKAARAWVAENYPAVAAAPIGQQE